MATKERISYLEKKVNKLLIDPEKHRAKFEKQARYLGNGVYNWCGQYSADVQELWLMGVLIHEGIPFKSE